MSNQQTLLPYIFGNTFTSVDDIQTIFYTTICNGVEPVTNVNTTNTDICLILSNRTWKQGLINYIVIRNDNGVSNYSIHLQAIDSSNSNEKAKALQNALNFKSVGSSAIIQLIKYGNGTSPVTINGTQVMAANTKYAIVLIQAINVTSGFENNSITILLNGFGQIQTTLFISGENTLVNYGNIINLVGTPNGFQNTQTYQWYLNSQPIINQTSSSLTNFEITSEMTSPLLFVLKATENDIITTSNTLSYTINTRNVSITGPSNIAIGEEVQYSLISTTGFNDNPGYQWYINNELVSGETGTNLNYIVPTNANSPLSFVLKASQSNVTTSSNIITSTIVIRSIQISRDTRSIYSNMGDIISLNANTTGLLGTQTYQWYLNNEPILDSTSSILSYKVSENHSDQILSFICVVKEQSFTLTSEQIDIYIQPRHISIIEPSQDIKIGDTLSLSLEISGYTNRPILKWYINDVVNIYYQNYDCIEYLVSSDTPVKFVVQAIYTKTSIFSEPIWIEPKN